MWQPRNFRTVQSRSQWQEPPQCLPGSFSALQLVSFMYTGLLLIDPSLDAGIDLSREFSMAKELLANPDGPKGS